ncbi:hypothetical protein BDW71DRAFT_211375 [Aspergillus fruticulosus]
MASRSADLPSYSQIACVGAGLSAVALGATLKRWYDLEAIRFLNDIPPAAEHGCGCDVPSALYSSSFGLNPNWTKLMPSNKEIKEYVDNVVDTYSLRRKMVFRTEDARRRIFDPGYLESLHSDKVFLTDAKAEKITADGIETDKGFIPADVIVLATGFQTNKFISYMDVVGRNGENVSQHWFKYGGPAAYNCSVSSGFPNFFMLLGPNAATGHTSAMMDAEK